MNESIKLIENIITWQGEGPDSGKRMLLLRYKKCNRVDEKIPCPWCDTLVKMRAVNEAEFSFKDIQESIYDNNVGLMITGGEPLHDIYFDTTFDLLKSLNYPYANIETNGCNLYKFMNYTRSDNLPNVKIIYSPKVFKATELEVEADLIKKCREFKSFRNVYIKIVVDDRRLTRVLIENICIRFDLNDKVYLMPQGKNRDELIKNSSIVFDYAEEFKTNISSREHLIYDFI